MAWETLSNNFRFSAGSLPLIHSNLFYLSCLLILGSPIRLPDHWSKTLTPSVLSIPVPMGRTSLRQTCRLPLTHHPYQASSSAFHSPSRTAILIRVPSSIGRGKWSRKWYVPQYIQFKYLTDKLSHSQGRIGRVLARYPHFGETIKPILDDGHLKLDEIDARVEQDSARMEEVKQAELERLADAKRKAAFEAERVIQAQRAEAERVRVLRAELASLAGDGNIINDPVSQLCNFSLKPTNIFYSALRLLRESRSRVQGP